MRIDWRAALSAIISFCLLLSTSLIAYHIQNGSVFPLLVIPIILWGFWFGTRAGLLSSIGFSLYTLSFIVLVLNRVHTLHYVAVATAVLLAVGFVVGRMSDLHRKLRAQEASLAEAKRKLEDQVEEKKLLLVDVHHRIKSDMELVWSLLLFQAAETEEPRTRESIEAAADRVQVVTKVYEKLYRSDNFRVLDVRELIRQLSRNLETALAPRSITLDVACSDFSLPNSAAVSLGIIVNELVTNAAIHAFDSQKTPNISLCVNGENGGALTLRVADNGVGVPGSVLRGEGYGYGLSIIDTLVEQLGGSWHLENDEGTRVTVSLPVVAGVVSPPARLAEAPLR